MYCDIKMCLYNHHCREKAISITYCLCVFVALGIQQEMRMHHIVFCGLYSFTTFLHSPDRWWIPPLLVFSFFFICFFFFLITRSYFCIYKIKCLPIAKKLDTEKYETTNEHHIQLSRHWVLYILI
jgi:hypothetical protein